MHTAIQQPTLLVPRPIRWANPSPAELARWVSEKIIEDPGNLVYTTHASRDRLEQRGFSHEDINEIITRGHAYRADKGFRPGEFKVNFARSIQDGRDAAVAVLVNPSTPQVTVVTVMWIDRSYYKS